MDAFGTQTNWLTYAEAARRVGRSKRNILRWRTEGLPMEWLLGPVRLNLEDAAQRRSLSAASPELAAEVTAFADSIADVPERRNRLVHDPVRWHDGHPQRYSSSRAWSSSGEPESEADMIAFHGRCMMPPSLRKT